MRVDTSRARILAIWVGFACCWIGCVPEDESEDLDVADEEGLGEARQDFTGYVSASETSNGPLESYTTAVGTNYNSFFHSVVGTMAKPGSTGPYVNTFVASGQFWLHARSGATGNLFGAVAAAAGPGDQATDPATCSHTGYGTPHTVNIPAPASGSTWRCFLNKVSNNNGSSFGSFNDQAYVWYDGGNGKLTCAGNAEAQATCIAVTSVHESVDFNGPDTNPIGPTATGKACFLTKVAGVFRTDSSSDGVTAYISGTTWYLDVDANKGGAALCVK